MEKDDLSERVYDTFLEGSEYERKRLNRRMYISAPIPTKLIYQSGLFALVGLALPLYVLFPAETSELLPSANPLVAAPKVILVGAVSYGFEAAGAIVLAATGLYHVRNDPPSERQADRILDFEGFGTLVGFGTGGLGALVFIGYFVLGALGYLDSYVRFMSGHNPFAPVQVPLTVGTFSVAAYLAAGGSLFAGLALRRKYPTT